MRESVCVGTCVCVRSVLGEACASALDRASEGEMRRVCGCMNKRGAERESLRVCAWDA